MADENEQISKAIVHSFIEGLANFGAGLFYYENNSCVKIAVIDFDTFHPIARIMRPSAATVKALKAETFGNLYHGDRDELAMGVRIVVDGVTFDILDKDIRFMSKVPFAAWKEKTAGD